MDDQKDRLKLLLKSCLLFLYSRWERPVNMSPPNPLYSATLVCWAVFSIQEVNKMIPSLLRNISCLLTKCWTCCGTERSFQYAFYGSNVYNCPSLGLINLPSFSVSLGLTFEEVEGSQTNACGHHQQVPTTRTQAWEKRTAAPSLSITAVLLLHTAYYWSIQKKTVFISPTYQVCHNYVTLWACPTYYPLKKIRKLWYLYISSLCPAASIYFSQVCRFPNTQSHHKGPKNCF